MVPVVAIDVETATPSPGSVCQIGLADCSAGAAARKQSWLVHPGCSIQKGYSDLHGITDAHVVSALKFRPIYQQHVAPILEGKVIAAHGRFDSRAMTAALLQARLDVPDWIWVDTIQIAREVWPDLPNHRIDGIAAHLGYSIRHHDAADDAVIAAVIVLRGLRLYRGEVEALTRAHGYRPEITDPAQRPENAWSRGYADRVRRDATGAGIFTGETVVLTGEFALPRDELAQAIAAAGGCVRDSVTRKTTVVFVAASASSAPPTGKVKAALSLQASGGACRLEGEADLLRRLSGG